MKTKLNTLWLAVSLTQLSTGASQAGPQTPAALACLQPWTKNPAYWQYQGRPVLLLGGSKDDNLFQLPDLEAHLEEMVSVGANYVRNTMSDRPDQGFEVYPFKRLPDGRYDLDEWNDEYWRRFAAMLRWTQERAIFVQIEVWDRFDYAQENWLRFIDVSQVNSRSFNEDHWNNFYWIVREIRGHPRPLNHVKIYSDGQTSWGSGTPRDGVERFWRNLIGGAASCRFHRPGGGIGLNEIARACIRAARKVESLVAFWDVEPRLDLLSDREPDEAYLAAQPGNRYILFFTDGGAVGLDLGGAPGPFAIRWVSIGSGEWGPSSEVAGDCVVTLRAPDKGPWAATLTR